LGRTETKKNTSVDYFFRFFSSLLPHRSRKKPTSIQLTTQTNYSSVAKCPFHHGGKVEQSQHAAIHLNNFITQKVSTVDTSHLQQQYNVGNGNEQSICTGSLMKQPNVPVVQPNRTPTTVEAEAIAFLQEYYKDNVEGDWESSYQQRIIAVKKDIQEKGYYFHTTEELNYGVQLAWRNASRCIMRSQWQNIKVIDARGGFAEYGKEMSTLDMYNRCVEHLQTAVTIGKTGNKNIQSQITIFPQLLPNEQIGRKIWNNQLIRFAGYKGEDGRILGDPDNVALTHSCIALGWLPPTHPTAFDVLPLIIQSADDGSMLLKELPEDAKLLVPITHPQFPEFDKLGIKWHAIPALSSLCVDIGGIQYTAAPFNGWYMGTEIGSRNLGDVQRYNLLPAMAKAMGLSTTSNRSLWKDRAMVELNAAVLHSFDSAGITIQDHQTASNAFVKHHKSEMETRGFIPADWVWITPPLGGSANTVFHQEMINFFIKPNFIESNLSLKDVE
jgi:nitric oxide synthase oxygenase domain/subunit